MERDLLLVLLGGGIGIAGTAFGTLITYVLQRQVQRSQWKHDDSIKLEERLRKDIDDLRGTRDIRTVLEKGEWAGGCFRPGTGVTMADGSRRLIELLRVGDELLTYEPASRRFSRSKISRIIRCEASEYVVVNNILAVTKSHFIFAGDEYVRVGALRLGPAALSDMGHAVPIVSLELRTGRCDVLNVDVESQQAFFAEGFLVGTFSSKVTDYGNANSVEHVEIDKQGNIVIREKSD